MAADRPLLLITIDTLRADHLGVNGASPAATPNLDRLARGGVNFSRARSPVPLTLPAHASILTGLYPPEHGVRDNGSFRLPLEVRTLAEVLADRGYDTAAFIGSFVLDRRFGLAQGFATYDDRAWNDLSQMESPSAERAGGEVVQAFEDWLADRRTDRPFFAWIHLYDPHAPYTPPEPFRSTYPQRPYVGEVAYVDGLVGRVLERLEAEGEASRTLVAVTGDHGEGLGQHGEGTHSLLIYNSTLHVPMLIHAPGLVPAGRQVDELVRLIDLSPTLLDLLGIDEVLGTGVSLRSRFTSGPAREEPLSAYSESLYPELQLGWSALRGLELGSARLIVAPTPELYDLSSDPGESRNVASAEASTYQHMKRELARLVAAFEGPGSAAALAPEAETRDRLRSLGYLGGGASDRARAIGSAVDPKERIEQWERMQLGMARQAAEDAAGAAEIFAAILAEDPTNLLAHEFMGAALEGLGQPRQAEAVYRQALQRGLDSAELHRRLGGLHQQRGELQEALRELEIARVLDPASVRSHFEAGQIHRQLGRPTAALECYRRALELNSSYLWAWNGLAMTLASSGQEEEALGAFERVVEIDPRGAAGLFNLAVHLERVGERNRAIQVYESFLAVAEGDRWASQRAQASEALLRLAD